MGDTTGYKKARGAIQSGIGEQRQLAGQAEQPYAPYQEAGVGALGDFQSALGGLLQQPQQDPQEVYQQFLGGYQESPFLQSQLDFGQDAANRAASASGMLGSGAEQQAAAGRAQSLRSQDMENYLNRMFGLRGQNMQQQQQQLQQYLSGQSGLAGLGAQAAGGVAGTRRGLGEQIGQAQTGIAQSYIGEAQQPSFGEQALGVAGKAAGAFLPFG